MGIFGGQGSEFWGFRVLSVVLLVCLGFNMDTDKSQARDYVAELSFPAVVRHCCGQCCHRTVTVFTLT